MKVNKFLKYLSCGVFASLYILVAVISLICSTEFFALAHSGTMSWVLAIGFEIGAMACLLSTLILPKSKQGLVWVMFVILTLFQCMSNTYMAYAHLDKFSGWIELFGLNELEPMAQKRILASISGAILPLVALGFIRIMANIVQGGTEPVPGTPETPGEIPADPSDEPSDNETVAEIEETWDEPEQPDGQGNPDGTQEPGPGEPGEVAEKPSAGTPERPRTQVPVLTARDRENAAPAPVGTEPEAETPKEPVIPADNEAPRAPEDSPTAIPVDGGLPDVPKVMARVYNPSTGSYM